MNHHRHHRKMAGGFRQKLRWRHVVKSEYRDGYYTHWTTFFAPQLDWRYGNQR